MSDASSDARWDVMTGKPSSEDMTNRPEDGPVPEDDGTEHPDDAHDEDDIIPIGEDQGQDAPKATDDVTDDAADDVADGIADGDPIAEDAPASGNDDAGNDGGDTPDAGNDRGDTPDADDDGGDISAIEDTGHGGDEAPADMEPDKPGTKRATRRKGATRDAPKAIWIISAFALGMTSGYATRDMAGMLASEVRSRIEALATSTDDATPTEEDAFQGAEGTGDSRRSEEQFELMLRRHQAKLRRANRMTDAQRAVVKEASTTDAAGPSMCLAWVNDVFENAGYDFERLWAASEACQEWCHSTDKGDLEPGMIVAVESTDTSPLAGHIGIYVGDDKVTSNETWGGEGVVRTRPLDEWLEMFGKVESPRWGWAGGRDLSR